MTTLIIACGDKDEVLETSTFWQLSSCFSSRDGSDDGDSNAVDGGGRNDDIRLRISLILYSLYAVYV